jgi:DNA-binding IclR family transcriptional regulator
MKIDLLHAIEDTGLRGNSRLVALELAYHAERGGIIRMGQTELAGHTGLSRRTVNNIFRDFEAMGLIEKVAYGRYRLTPENFIDIAEATAVLPGAAAELERLQGIRQEDEAICYTKEGWPVLTDMQRRPLDR